MFTGSEIVEILGEMQATHVVALPDSTLGLWEDDLRGRFAETRSRLPRGRSLGDCGRPLPGGRQSDCDDPMHGAV